MRFVPSRIHTFIGLSIGVLMLVSPLLLGFLDNSLSSMVMVFVGLFVILSELTTTSFFSPLRLVPMRVHLFIEFITGVLLAVSPFLFGFFAIDSLGVWLPHLLLGTGMVIAALITTTDDDTVPTVMSPSR